MITVIRFESDDELVRCCIPSRLLRSLPTPANTIDSSACYPRPADAIGSSACYPRPADAIDARLPLASQVRLCNDCPFALGSSAFGDDAHVTRVGKRIHAGMLACNDFATCYMCQSLPMGGLKDSGFGKFAGIEGLRGCCLTKAVVEDRFSFMRTQVGPARPLLTESATRDARRPRPSRRVGASCWALAGGGVLPVARLTAASRHTRSCRRR